MGLSRQEYWGGLPFPSPGDLPDPGIELVAPALEADCLPSELQGSFAYNNKQIGSYVSGSAEVKKPRYKCLPAKVTVPGARPPPHAD